MPKIIEFIKKETILIIATILAIVSAYAVPPSRAYFYYIDWRVLGILLSLMIVMAGVQKNGLFAVLTLQKCRQERLMVPEKSGDIQGQADGSAKRKKNMVYLVLFVLSILVVMRLLPYYLVLVAVLVSVFIMDRKVLVQVDYCLLFTFISFFIFTGNMGNLPAVRDTLQSLVAGRELGIGILTSQIISNVPAALLLSGFTEDYRTLLLGVNIGGLGTLIASMASLISYKIYAQHYNRTKGIYFLWFTVANLLFLAILLLVAAGMTQNIG